MKSLALLIATLGGCISTGCNRYEFIPPMCGPSPVPEYRPTRVVSASPDSGSFLRGRFVDERDGNRLYNAQLVLSDTAPGAKPRWHVSADSSGRFGPIAVAAARYRIRGYALAYYPWQDTLTVQSGESTELLIPLRQDPNDGCPGFMMVRVRKPWWKW